jgi:TrmH family RNA methyltransferase
MSAQLEFRPLSQARRKIFMDLGTRNGRERRGLYLLDAPRAIEDALARGARFPWIVASEAGEPLVRRWSEAGLLGNGVEVYRATAGDVDAMSDARAAQGVVAIGPIPPHALTDLPADLGPLALVADGVQDPGNLGTLLRTLAAVGGRVGVLCRGTVDPWNPKALRGAAGAHFGLALAAGVTPGAAVAFLAERGVATVALTAGAPNLFEAPLPEGPLALAVGNEGAGLSPETTSGAAAALGLPMAAGVESLSAAVAGSVALYGLARRRGILP